MIFRLLAAAGSHGYTMKDEPLPPSISQNRNHQLHGGDKDFRVHQVLAILKILPTTNLGLKLVGSKFINLNLKQIVKYKYKIQIPLAS